jgi:hypothetical protein
MKTRFIAAGWFWVFVEFVGVFVGSVMNFLKLAEIKLLLFSRSLMVTDVFPFLRRRTAVICCFI